MTRLNDFSASLPGMGAGGNPPSRSCHRPSIARLVSRGLLADEIAVDEFPAGPSTPSETTRKAFRPGGSAEAGALEHKLRERA